VTANAIKQFFQSNMIELVAHARVSIVVINFVRYICCTFQTSALERAETTLNGKLPVTKYIGNVTVRQVFQSHVYNVCPYSCQCIYTLHMYSVFQKRKTPHSWRCQFLTDFSMANCDLKLTSQTIDRVRSYQKIARFRSYLQPLW